MKRTNRKIFPFAASSPSSGNPTSPFDFLISGFGLPNLSGVVWANLTAAVGNTTSAFYAAFYLMQPLVVSHITINVGTVGGAGSQFTVGIYKMTGVGSGTLITSATFNTSTGQATGNRTATVTQVTLPAGWYWFAWATNETATTTFAAFSMNVFIESTTNFVGNQVRFGQKNPAVAGTLDSSVSGIVAASNFGVMPLAVFEL